MNEWLTLRVITCKHTIVWCDCGCYLVSSSGSHTYTQEVMEWSLDLHQFITSNTLVGLILYKPWPLSLGLWSCSWEDHPDSVLALNPTNDAEGGGYRQELHLVTVRSHSYLWGNYHTDVWFYKLHSLYNFCLTLFQTAQTEASVVFCRKWDISGSEWRMTGGQVESPAGTYRSCMLYSLDPHVFKWQYMEKHGERCGKTWGDSQTKARAATKAL